MCFMDMDRRYTRPLLVSFEDNCQVSMKEVDKEYEITVTYPTHTFRIPKDLVINGNLDDIIKETAIQSATMAMIERMNKINSERYAKIPTYAGFKPICTHGLNRRELLCDSETYKELTDNDYAAIEWLRKGLYSKK